MSPQGENKNSNCTKERALFHVKQRAFVFGNSALLLPGVGLGVGERIQNGMCERGNGFDVALL